MLLLQLLQLLLFLLIAIAPIAHNPPSLTVIVFRVHAPDCFIFLFALVDVRVWVRARVWYGIAFIPVLSFYNHCYPPLHQGRLASHHLQSNTSPKHIQQPYLPEQLQPSPPSHHGPQKFPARGIQHADCLF